MVHSVVAAPVVEAALVGHRVHEHQCQAQRPGGGVGAVRPEAMCARSDAQTGHGPEEEAPEQGAGVAERRRCAPEIGRLPWPS